MNEMSIPLQIATIIVVIVLAFGMCGIIRATFPESNSWDDTISLTQAKILAKQGYFANNDILLIHPPLYSIILSFFIKIDAEHFRSIVSQFQLLIHLISTLLVIFISSRFLPPTWRYISGFFYAINPQLAYLTSVLDGTIVLIFLMLLALLAFDNISELHGTFAAVLSGIFFALVALIEPFLFFFPLVVIIFQSLFKRNILLIIRYFFVLLFLLIILSPWIYHNWTMTKEIALFPFDGGIRLYQSVAPVQKGFYDKSFEKDTKTSILDKEKIYRKKAFNLINSDPKGLFFIWIEHFFEIWNFQIAFPEKSEKEGFALLFYSKKETFPILFWIFFFLLLQLSVTTMAIWAYNLRGIVRENGGAYPFMLHSFSWYLLLIFSFLVVSPLMKLILYPILSIFAAISLHYLFLINRTQLAYPKSRMISCILSMIFLPIIILYRPIFALFQFLLYLII